MRRDLAQFVQAGFAKRVQTHLPAFQQLNTSETLPPYCHAYEREWGSDFASFLMLQIHSFDPMFTIEIGWGEAGKFPLLGDFVSGRVDIDQVAARVRARLRLSSLWTDRAHWWKVSSLRILLQGAAEAAEPQIDDAWQHLIDKGIPALDKVGESRGFAPILR